LPCEIIDQVSGQNLDLRGETAFATQSDRMELLKSVTEVARGWSVTKVGVAHIA
jgi:hypothetical protein